MCARECTIARFVFIHCKGFLLPWDIAKVRKTIVNERPGLIVLYSDGSVDRPSVPFPPIPPSSHSLHGVATKDVLIHTPTDLKARIFLPAAVAEDHEKQQRLPLVLHFHGGGTCVGSAFADPFHSFCCRMALKSRSIWFSLEYRLAPEHPLPAAYDDAQTALSWLRSQAAAAEQHGTGVEEWLWRFADFSNCFVAGESAGGAIVHNLAMRVRKQDLAPLQIRGLVLVHASLFRHKPRKKPSADDSLTQQTVDTYFRFAVGSEKDAFGDNQVHPFLNPFHPDSPSLFELPSCSILVMTADRDILADANAEYFEALQKAGKAVELFVSKGEGHCFHLKEAESEESNRLEARIVRFIMEEKKPSNNC